MKRVEMVEGDIADEIVRGRGSDEYIAEGRRGGSREGGG